MNGSLEFVLLNLFIEKYQKFIYMKYNKKISIKIINLQLIFTKFIFFLEFIFKTNHSGLEWQCMDNATFGFTMVAHKFGIHLIFYYSYNCLISNWKMTYTSN